MMRLFKKTKQAITHHTGASVAALSIMVGVAAHAQAMSYNKPLAAVVTLAGIGMGYTSYEARRRRQHLDYLTLQEKPDSWKPTLNRMMGHATTMIYATSAAAEIVIAADSEQTQLLRSATSAACLAPVVLMQGVDAYQDLFGYKSFQRKAPRSHVLMQGHRRKKEQQPALA